MLSKFSDTLKEAMVAELIEFEKDPAQRPKEENYNVIGSNFVLKYTTPDSTGEVPILIVEDGGFFECASAVRFTEGSVKIVVLESEFTNLSTIQLFAVLAHELGHVMSGHLAASSTRLSIPMLYREENTAAIEAKDQERHTYISTKGVVDGSYLDMEYEADEVAVRFVGIDYLLAGHVATAFTYHTNNPLIAIENFNRMRALMQAVNANHGVSKNGKLDGYELELTTVDTKE